MSMLTARQTIFPGCSRLLLPVGLREEYLAAIASGLSTAEAALPNAWDADAEVALRGSIAVFRGDLAGARAILDAELDEQW
ncbi:MAG: hypothetical protein U0974_14715 [Gemmatimonadales bacterium]|nr:hypothetical protein [Gemmatimonadales bacterium]MDZ4390970.1 hypothetical protein [Gemmatimonadales bacterium]